MGLLSFPEKKGKSGQREGLRGGDGEEVAIGI